MNSYLIGTSGWMYDHWNERFYPQDLEGEEKLAFYGEHFSTVEINNTFYQLPEAETFRTWGQQSPQDFTFSIKVSRYITHMKNLLDAEEPLGRLLEHASHLNDKTGPFLFQLPPHWTRNRERLEGFISLLPHSQRFAFEFRNKTWYTDEILALLAEHNHALVIHDHADAPSPIKKTAGWLYVRFHGPGGGYEGKYSTQQLEDWAKRLEDLEANEGAYLYFNNDMEANAIENAKSLQHILDA